MTGSWAAQAICWIDPEAFFPISYTSDIGLLQVEEARTFCAFCPVQAACLQDALTREAGQTAKQRKDNGIRGGWTPAERARGRQIQDRRQKQNRRHGLAA